MVVELQKRLNVPEAALADYCRKWRVRRLEVFGSILRDDFGPDSDVDFLVSFEPEAPWTLLDLARAENELSELVRREVDLVEREPLEESHNWIRRREILGTARSLYVA